MTNPTVTNVDGTNTGPTVVSAPTPVAGGGPLFRVANVASDLVAFYGCAGAAQAAAITAVGTSAPVAACASFGLTSTQLTAMVTAVNAIITALKGTGSTL